jgi:hypothetical protein
MKVSVCLLNHNQNEQITNTLSILKKQVKKPEHIFICSDAKSFYSKDDSITCINKKNSKELQNNLIKEFFDSESDAIIFIAGDTYPKAKDFILNYSELLEKNDLVFGTLEHTNPRFLESPPTDLLTANMENMWHKERLDFTDLRVSSGAFLSWNNAKTFNHKLDLLITGLISACNNFAFTRKSLEKYLAFMNKTYNRNEIIDSSILNIHKGTALGIDALYAGLTICVSEDVIAVHKVHEREEPLFGDIVNKHLILERVRNLDKTSKIKDRAYISMMLLFLMYIAGIITGLITGYISFMA